MPIVKIPLEHKFGIVSLARAEELLAKNPEKITSRRSNVNSLPEINQAFVAKYNSKPETSRESLDALIKKALLHNKYKTGLVQARHSSSAQPHKSSDQVQTPLLIGVSPYDTSIAWLELTLLCQCYGPLQQEVLLTLCASLNHSPLSVAHIPSLVYIAGLCYQWLKSDVLSNDLLRTGELILLKIVYLVSLRLYYHHLSGYLTDCCTKDEIRHLKFDLEGFENKEGMYKNMPEALLQWKVTLKVGLLVCEQFNKSQQDLSLQSQILSLTCKDPINKSPSADSNTTSHGGSNLSSVLWHSLDIWQCTKQESTVLQEAIHDFLACSTRISAEKWMEGILAMNILCTASQLNATVLDLVQSLALGETQPKQPPQPTPQIIPPVLTPAKSNEASSSPVNDEVPVKGTRFLLPTGTKMEFSYQEDSHLPSTQSKPNKVETLNMLGVQPDFNVQDNESLYTADQTVYQIGETSRPLETASVGDISLMQRRYPRGVPTGMLARYTYAPSYLPSGLGSVMTASSVGTQSLIENDSIPDVLPSTVTSNVTMLDLGSITTLGESLVALLTSSSSNSKSLDFSVSNLVSPGLGPSRELISIEELMSSSGGSARKVDSVEDSSVVDDQLPSRETDVAEVERDGSDHKEFVDSQHSSDHADTDTPHQNRSGDTNLLEAQHKTETPVSRNLDTRCTHYTHSTAPLLGGANTLGSQVHPSTVLRHGMLSSEKFVASSPANPITTPPREEPFKFEDWPCEVALMYTINMASIAIYGRTSLIQRNALEGNIERESVCGRYGLLELAGFEINGNSEKRNNFPSWSIRHGAVLGLSRVAKTCRSLPMKDGLSNVAWSKLVERHTAEHDPRVLQAFKISQVGPDFDGPMFSLESKPFSSPLLVHMADGLSELFLPSPPTAHSITTLSSKIPTPRAAATVSAQTKRLDWRAVQPRVMTEVDRSKVVPTKPNFNSRTFNDLNKIATRHWKKQINQELEEEMERRKEEKKEIEHEEKMKKKAEKLTKRKQKSDI